MKRRLEEMESANHENFPLVMKIVKSYCKAKKKNETMRLRRMAGMQVIGRDTNGKLILVPKLYSEATRERKLREEEKRNKKIADGRYKPEPPRQPRWSDENMAVHIWRGMCSSKGVLPKKYELREDYRNMNPAEINLDLLFRKVYKAKEEEEEEAATAS